VTDDEIIREFRRKLEKTLRKCDEYIADTNYIGERRPEMAIDMAPDAHAHIYATRQWAVKALAALDAGEPIPPPPESKGGD
jgi:hypothetical protein